ncbi:hypothetical protein N7676_00525 [Stenotrophomonas sp. GD03993]|uniref:hypothetical protein n=1 Tax=unclassified Stenotrophomonas TaxID=196198 RepID=UPI00244987A6|nr:MULTISPECIES: hypothetical protein [unclassified Stenotrophomonas]MDH0185931.1 hypothetical protein [Stenotrophomonas sp. GD04051]MDH0462297.1 hypothetical protein [Stenotrophomonas sp. GD03993]MDH0875100.1 hypothetical protein [Stenotrophomonas sp. GD03877]MDH2154624.1 hypothetical protein [Stenotrophomonas sp. GD03657]
MKVLKALTCILTASVGVGLVWLSVWLYMNRVFADPTALPPKDALAAQAAWAQAILSVFAVLAAVWVARGQAKQSQKLISDELARVREKEGRESAERQSLACTALQSVFNELTRVIALLCEDDYEKWAEALMLLRSGSSQATKDFQRVAPVLNSTPSGALHCFNIEQSLQRFENAMAEYFQPLVTRDEFGRLVFGEITDPGVAKEVAARIQGDEMALLEQIARL